jgi:hypothetical protein
MPGNLLFPKLKRNAITVAAAAATANSSAIALAGALGDSYVFALEVTAASGTSPTLDVVVQTSFDGGTNWHDLPLRYTQKTAANGAGTSEMLVFKLGLGMNEVALAQVTADTGGQLAKNCLFDPGNLRLRYTIGGTNPSFTFALHTAILPKGANAQY